MQVWAKVCGGNCVHKLQACRAVPVISSFKFQTQWRIVCLYTFWRIVSNFVKSVVLELSGNDYGCALEVVEYLVEPTVESENANAQSMLLAMFHSGIYPLSPAVKHLLVDWWDQSNSPFSDTRQLPVIQYNYYGKSPLRDKYSNSLGHGSHIGILPSGRLT